MKATYTLLAFIMLTLCSIAQTSVPIDPTFSLAPVGGSYPIANCLALQPDGKVIVGGEFDFCGTLVRHSIGRLNSDGNGDTTFNSGAGAGGNGGFLVSVYDIALQTDGKIIIGGNFTTYNGIARNRIARLNSDGSLDTTFNPGTGADAYVSSIAMQPDGKIIIGGNFTTYDSSYVGYFTRLNTDGSLDSTFSSGASSEVHDIVLQPDGNMIVAGDFGVVRFDTTGAYDGTFSCPVHGIIKVIGLQSNGKMMIAGGSYLNRLNSNGSIDNSYGGTGVDNDVLAILVQPDGKIILGGIFNTYNGTSRNGLARLNSDRTLDYSFNPGTGVPSVAALAYQPDGKLIIGTPGGFTDYNGTYIMGVTRLTTNPIFLNSPYPPNLVCSGSSFPLHYRAPNDTFNAGNTFTVWLSDSAGNGKICNVGSITSTADTGTILVTLPDTAKGSNHYIIQIESSNPVIPGAGLQLHITPIPVVTIYDTIYSGQPYQFGSLTLTAPGIYRDTLQNVYGCDSIVILHLISPPSCHAHYTIYPDTTTPHHWFALNQSTGSGPLTCTWYWGDGSHTIGDTASHIYSLAGYYNMCLIVSDTTGCSSTYCDASTYVYKTEEVITINAVWQLPVSTGVSSFSNQQSTISIYPNPTSDKLFIQTNGTAIEQVNIYNTTGSLVMAAASLINNQLSIVNLQSGVYIAEIKTKEGSVRKRWVKM